MGTQDIAHVETKDIVLVETQDIALLETKSWLHLFVQKPQEFVACVIAEMLLVRRKREKPKPSFHLEKIYESPHRERVN